MQSKNCEKTNTNLYWERDEDHGDSFGDELHLNEHKAIFLLLPEGALFCARSCNRRKRCTSV